MLNHLRIKNFVLIEELSLSLAEGLNVLTGETGAGKSIALDAIGLLLGARFPSEAVRQGTSKAEIDGVFDAPRTREFKAWWDEKGFEKAGEVIVRREGMADGRSRAFLNDRPVTLATLAELGEFLVDIHGQNEHQRILAPSVQLAALDRFGGLGSETEAIAPLFRTWQSLDEERNAGALSEQERIQRLDLMRFQLSEIDGAKIKPGEEDALALRLPELKNAERLRAFSSDAYAQLYEGEGSAIEKLGHVEKIFQSLATLAPSAEPLAREILDARSRLEEAAHALQAMTERWEVDPEALDAALSRQEVLSRLNKKYGGTLAAVLSHGETLRTDIEKLENADQYKQELEKRFEKAQEALAAACKALSLKRQAAAKKLGQAVQKQLADLGLEKAIFRCRVESYDAEKFTLSGSDRVVFEWSPNPGEGIQPLKNIASGGEMSRVMLALKTVLAASDEVPILIFDEVDAGIGGLTAQAVGRKLRALSQHHQILCVSHLPQIASAAHAHFQVSKSVHKDRTTARIVRLATDDRLNELARLLGSNVTPTSVQHARELLEQNQ